MKVASNKVADVLHFYYSELNILYERSEIDAIIKLVFEHYLGFSRNEIQQRINENLNQSDLLKVYDCCKELLTGKPLQYIIKESWFYNHPLFVNEHVLIPRPETEELVSVVLKENPDAKSILDIGTGSGCIPVTIKAVLKSAEVSACDISEEALKVAKKNSDKLHAHVHFYFTDILQTDDAIKKTKGNFEIIISNPPYIKESEASSLAVNVIGFEPHEALFVTGDDDIIFYKKIIDFCHYKLEPGGRLYFELNHLTAWLVKEYADASGLFDSAEIFRDMSGKLRFMKAVKKNI
jgi:release factor glutamine methyltransferase